MNKVGTDSTGVFLTSFCFLLQLKITIRQTTKMNELKDLKSNTMCRGLKSKKSILKYKERFFVLTTKVLTKTENLFNSSHTLDFEPFLDSDSFHPALLDDNTFYLSTFWFHLRYHPAPYRYILFYHTRKER